MKPVNAEIDRNKKIANIRIKEEFTLINATIYCGCHLFSDYLESNGLDRLLEQKLVGMKARWAT
jgi:hypothetical protein